MYFCTAAPHQPTTQNDNKFAKPFNLKCPHCFVDSLVLLLLFHPFSVHCHRRRSFVRSFVQSGSQFLVAVQTNLSKCMCTVYTLSLVFARAFFRVMYHFFLHPDINSSRNKVQLKLANETSVCEIWPMGYFFRSHGHSVQD